MEQIVTGCIDCPLNSIDTEGATCRHPSVRDEDGMDRGLPSDPENGYKTITPDWCPLNKEPITVIKK